MSRNETIWEIVKNFNPVFLARNPAMFLTEVSLVITVAVALFPTEFNASSSLLYEEFYASVITLLFLTLLFSSISIALSEGKSKAIAESLREFRKVSIAHLLVGDNVQSVSSVNLKKGDIIVIERSEHLPTDGEVLEGQGYVNESNITGESRPVLKTVGDSVTGSTTLVSDHLKVMVTADPGETFIDKMIEVVGKASRERTPNEIALSVLLSGISLVLLIAVAALFTASRYLGISTNIVILTVLLVCLIPTTIGGLLPAIGIAAVNKVSEFNVIAKSGKAVENAGDIDTIILDKTGTVTLGEREAVRLHPARGVSDMEFTSLCAMASYQDSTKEGLSILSLATRGGADIKPKDLEGYEFVPFSAETKMSGIEREGEYIMKGALKALSEKYSIADKYIEALCKEISLTGGTAIPVVKSGHFMGVIELNDLLKPGIKQRLEILRESGIKTIMCTGDDAVTAQYIAEQSGIDEFVANSTPMDKYNVVKAEKGKQRMVAMVGDGTNDAPALAIADVGMAMNSGTPAAKEAANMIDLDNDPTKLLDIIFMGKQILITRGSLTTFSIANDVAKYFVIIPAIFYMLPQLSFVNLLNLKEPLVAITAALVFNTFIILTLIPLALRGVRYTPGSMQDIFRTNILKWGVGGLIVPFIAIGIIYLIFQTVGVIW